mmetsp:Transcript_5851/g.8663  ORF Transcript_5851/g.8663 Transcript_5851/m.8663 type:complete len:88 (-) Transcript_5851:358-621(-)
MEPQRMSYETGVTISTVSEEDKAFAVSGTEANVFSRLHNIYSAQAIDDIAFSFDDIAFSFMHTYHWFFVILSIYIEKDTRHPHFSHR